jgi:hypothetical protein
MRQNGLKVIPYSEAAVILGCILEKMCDGNISVRV